MKNDATVKIRLPEDKRLEWVAAAAGAEKTLTAYITDAVDARVLADEIADQNPDDTNPGGLDDGAVVPVVPVGVSAIAANQSQSSNRRCPHGLRSWCPVCDR